MEVLPQALPATLCSTSLALPFPPQSPLPEAHLINCKTDCFQDIGALPEAPPIDTWAPFCHISCARGAAPKLYIKSSTRRV